MKIRLASEITRDSIVDGPGLRAVVWAQGCSHNCPGCHNPATHDFKGGFETFTMDVIEKRVAQAEQELGLRDQYDYCVVNDDLDTAVADFLSVVRAIELQVKK